MKTSMRSIVPTLSRISRNRRMSISLMPVQLRSGTMMPKCGSSGCKLNTSCIASMKKPEQPPAPNCHTMCNEASASAEGRAVWMRGRLASNPGCSGDFEFHISVPARASNIRMASMLLRASRCLPPAAAAVEPLVVHPIYRRQRRRHLEKSNERCMLSK